MVNKITCKNLQVGGGGESLKESFRRTESRFRRLIRVPLVAPFLGSRRLHLGGENRDGTDRSRKSGNGNKKSRRCMSSRAGLAVFIVAPSSWKWETSVARLFFLPSPHISINFIV